MTPTKTYLNVPYAEKDAAKALGARWDPAVKKWYIPAGKDITAFAKWQLGNETTLSFNSGTSTRKPKPSQGNGVFTHPTIDPFVAYSGDKPPWD